MSIYELLDVLASNYQKIDGLWNFFITIHLAILGALFLMPRRVSLPERGVALLAYGAFSFVNRAALVDTYDYHRVVLDEIARLKVPPDQTGGLLVQQLSHFHLMDKIAFLAWSHYVAAVVVAFAFFFANALARHGSAET